MSVKTSADVLIGGKIYTLSGYESEEYLQKVANYINNKLNEFDEMEQFRQIPLDMKATLLELNIADDYFKAKEQAEMLEKTVREKEREIYELQHDLISAKIKVESSEETAANLEKENKELLLNKAKLETSLADALLGKVKGQTLADSQPVSENQNGNSNQNGNKNQDGNSNQNGNKNQDGNSSQNGNKNQDGNSNQNGNGNQDGSKSQNGNQNAGSGSRKKK